MALQQLMGLDSPHARHAADISGQAVGLPKRASSAPLDGRTRLPGLHLGRLIGLGSFGKVYKGVPSLPQPHSSCFHYVFEHIRQSI